MWGGNSWWHTEKLCRTKGMETKGKSDKGERPGLLSLPVWWGGGNIWSLEEFQG